MTYPKSNVRGIEEPCSGTIGQQNRCRLLSSAQPAVAHWKKNKKWTLSASLRTSMHRFGLVRDLQCCIILYNEDGDALYNRISADASCISRP